MLLAPFFVASIVYYSAQYHAFVAVGIFSLGVLSDALDGYIAQRRNQKSQLGTFLDPIADKFLLISAFVCLSVSNNLPLELRFPPWVPIIIISRDIIILLGSVVIYMITGNIQIKPSALGKITTFFQMIAIISLLLQFPYQRLILYLAIFFTLISGIDYVKRGSALVSAAS